MTAAGLDHFGLPGAEASAPVSPAAFAYAGATDAGRVRLVNEDSYLLAPEIGVFAVADGMGGHEAGDLASATVVECLASIGAAVSPSDLLARLEDRILRANTRLRDLAQARGRIVGSTVAALLLFEQDFACVWSGDSRIYRMRAGSLEQLSHDHTEVQQLVDSGVLTPEEARTWPRRNVITRAVGAQPEPEIELTSGVLEPGDIFLLCSDGLTGHAEPEDLRAHLDTEPGAACAALVALALERGGSDNVTVVVVRYDPNAEPAPEPGSRGEAGA